MPNYGQLRRNPSTDTLRIKTKNANLKGKTKIDSRGEDCAPPKDTPTKNKALNGNHIAPRIQGKHNATKEEETDTSNQPKPERARTPLETPTMAEGASNATKTTAYGVLVQACWTQPKRQYPAGALRVPLVCTDTNVSLAASGVQFRPLHRQTSVIGEVGSLGRVDQREG